jgi:hypothetical protein
MKGMRGRLLPAALVGTLAACASGGAGVELGWKTTTPRVDPGKDPEGAALEFASNLWATALAHCGDFYFSMEQTSSSGAFRLVEYKDVDFRVEPVEVTASDRAANVEWIGDVHLSAAARRWRRSGHSWSYWEPAGEVAKVTLRLIRRGWFATRVQPAAPHAAFAAPPDCSSLPPIPSPD